MNTKSLKSRYASDQLTETDSISKILFALNASRDSLIDELEQNYPQYFRIKYDPHIPTLTEIQSQLIHEQEAALVYFLDEGYLYRFDIRKDAVDFSRKELSGDFAARIRDFRQLVYAPLSSETDDDFVEMQQAYVSEAKGLYDLLLPTPNDFEGIQQLKIIPDGVLSMLSMDLLLREAPSDIGNLRNYAWAIKDYEFSYLYSMGLWMYLEETRSAERPEPKLLAFQPSYPATDLEEGLFAERRAGFGPLKFSEAEVKGISDFYSAEILSGKQANEANFYKMADEYPIIHISSHAMVPEKKQRDAFIALSQSEDGAYDDSLMIEELYSQRLKAEMVVLSACETGLGELAEGEGVLSLGRAFTYAGARSLIMSLWEVNDESTAEIMTDFYKYLAEGDAKSTALRKAKLAYIEKSDQLESQPYFWAAFLASGDMQPLPEKSSNSWLWLLAILGIIGIFWGIKKR
ncbi:MAG: CHAT domain-containing protein [Bacteroidota bacterium]